ncbi:AMP-binding protein [Marivirga sp.]|uniref:AMP-binding protein n=1 Tax=Marivirga sp. TaxID=2018662 RepID=UPI002D8004A9|nr:AMP-binding protein [Marivirga sp.]HET8860590.1 AMP-binding protein [Marivirga sp.]
MVKNPLPWIKYCDRKWTLQAFLNEPFNEHLLRSVHDFIEDWNNGKMQFEQKTSGSTGKPKIILISRSQMIASAKATLESLNLKAGDTALLTINPEFIGGKMMIVRCLVGQLNLIIGNVSGNPLKNLKEPTAIDFYSFVPYQLLNILNESGTAISMLSQSKAIILGGAAVPEVLKDRIKENLDTVKVYSTYGMTETISHVALQLINSKNIEPYKALQDIKFSVDENDCLIIHAPQITGEGSLKTKDVVSLISPTEFYWKGRFDFVINSGGIKIHPEELEKEIATLLQNENIPNRFFIFGKEDEKLGNAVQLIIEGDYDTNFISSLLKKHLLKYHLPKNIFRSPKFIETENGKINRIETITTLK